MVFENTVLFMRDALLLRLLTDVIKCGNSGRLVLLLKPLALFYRGTGHSNYMQELLYLLHNLTNVWPEPLRCVCHPTAAPLSNDEASQEDNHEQLAGESNQ